MCTLEVGLFIINISQTMQNIPEIKLYYWLGFFFVFFQILVTVLLSYCDFHPFDLCQTPCGNLGVALYLAPVLLLQVFTMDELQMIADLCIKHDTLCFSDEVYEWLIYKGHQHVKIGTLPPQRLVWRGQSAVW